MLRILLVDDEPLVLIGLQGMLEWEKLGYTVCGTARNGKLALELIEREKPDIVIADVKMPVMDGLTLARTCRERSALPAFIMLTSFEEFDYIKQAMGAGVVDYLVKLDLTPENLQTALAKAAEKVKKERALLGELSAQENLAESVRSYQERFFVRLYAGLFPDEAALEQPLQHMELNLASDAYLVASCEIIANTALTPAQQLKLSFSCGRMLETTLQNYLPCYVTGADAMRCNVLFCLTDAQCHTEYEIENTGYHAHGSNGNISVDCRLRIQHHSGHAGQSLSHHTGEACCKNVLMYGKFPGKIFRCQAALGLSTQEKE